MKEMLTLLMLALLILPLIGAARRIRHLPPPQDDAPVDPDET